ncbi:cupin domain-containing protein [Pontixanthobacter aestiaquae]|uniref:Cupin domain-containing protein n=1 Tax=Pontixanthobacter aestiaquae TaxID=1509367 RepID=A0A844ZBW4_9SPHN|nr:cupin domain-containing protein [Pontixanthobacter aestiaquae]MDN3644593.1 cupin domain-containing protein [Pontixanthobacter aestiaquae]MXO84400.1 cupin domain-containing protein [Pontixanthobacter aestiaquae]
MAAVTPTKVDLADKFSQFSDHWAPRIVARYNDNEVRLAKAEGDFQWHSHADSDELFLVVKGRLTMEFRDRTETLEAGQMIVIPRGVEHRPRALDGEVEMIIIDPKDTANTGNPETATKAVEI